MGVRAEQAWQIGQHSRGCGGRRRRTLLVCHVFWRALCVCVCVSVFVVVLPARWAAFDRFTDAELNNLEPFARHDSARETERDVARVSTGKNAATQIRTHTRTHTHTHRE